MYLRSTLNNSTNASTGKSPNEIAYGINKETDILNEGNKEQTNIIDNSNGNRQEAADALAFAAFDTKLRYDGRHQAVTMEPGEKAYI